MASVSDTVNDSVTKSSRHDVNILEEGILKTKMFLATQMFLLAKEQNWDVTSTEIPLSIDWR